MLVQIDFKRKNSAIRLYAAKYFQNSDKLYRKHRRKNKKCILIYFNDDLQMTKSAKLIPIWHFAFIFYRRSSTPTQSEKLYIQYILSWLVTNDFHDCDGLLTSHKSDECKLAAKKRHLSP